MGKPAIRRLVIFFGIVLLFPGCYLIYILFLQSDLYYSLHGAGDGVAIIRTWQDTNANGIREQGEPPLPHVCVGYVDSLNELIRQTGFLCQDEDRTDSQGVGGSEFLPGWTGKIYKYAFLPEGYQPTTDMVSVGDAEFGFIGEGVKISREIETVNDFIRRELIIRWLRYISIAFFVFVIALYATIKLEKQFFSTEFAR